MFYEFKFKTRKHFFTEEKIFKHSKRGFKKNKIGKHWSITGNCSSCRYYPIKISCRLNFDNLSMLLTSFSKYYQSDNKLYKYYTIR